jgi:Domain of unknown function (DUF4432)
MRTHGGRQEGVCIVDIDTGAMKISVVPTRGMNVLGAVAGNVRIGWESPVSEVVNPAFIELNGRGGLGWLEGFNEMVVRCGYEWVATREWIRVFSFRCMAWQPKFWLQRSC